MSLSWMALWALIVYLSLLSFMLRTPAAQGRLLFPAIVPLGLGLGYGLSRWPRPVALGLAPALALLSSVAGLATIGGAYDRPVVIVPESIPAEANRVDAVWDEQLSLLAIDLPAEPVPPGTFIPLTFYWQAPSAPASLFATAIINHEPSAVVPNVQPAVVLVVELFGYDETLVGKYEGYHGRGQWPERLWPASGVIVDHLGIQLAEVLDAPTLVQIQLRLFCRDGTDVALAQSKVIMWCPPEIQEQVITVGYVRVEPTAWPTAPTTTLAVWDDGLALTALSMPEPAAAGQTITLTASWRVDAPTDRRLTTFVHLGPAGSDTPAAPLVTGDRPPLAGAYPTDFWPAGAVLADDYELTLPADLPAGRYPIWIGLYDETGRAPLLVDGTRAVDDAFLAGWVVVGE